MPEQRGLITREVLRRHIEEQIRANDAGTLSDAELRGYLIAMFHAGALSIEECSGYIKGDRTFCLAPPPSDADDPTMLDIPS